MSRQPNELKKRSGAELRDAAAARQQQADPAFEANRREASFLANLSRAQADFEWIAENQAWTLLGHDSLADWWAAKVQPVMVALSMRLTPEMASRVIEKVKATEAHLPASQRRTKAELAALVGTSEWTARGRQDPRERRTAAVTDLENPPTDPVAEFPEVLDAVDTLLANRSTPADELEEDHPAAPGDEDGAPTPSDAQPQAGDVSNDAGSDETEADDAASQQSSAEVELPQEQPAAGVSAAAPAGGPEHSGRSEEQGQAAVSVPAPEELDEEQRLQALVGLAESLCEYIYPHEPHNYRNEDERGIAYAYACPGVPVPNPVALLEAFADQYELLDADAHGPLMTDAEFEALGAALIRVTNVVELLIQWRDRTNP